MLPSITKKVLFYQQHELNSTALQTEQLPFKWNSCTSNGTAALHKWKRMEELHFKWNSCSSNGTAALQMEQQFVQPIHCIESKSSGTLETWHTEQNITLSISKAFHVSLYMMPIQSQKLLFENTFIKFISCSSHF